MNKSRQLLLVSGLAAPGLALALLALATALASSQDKPSLPIVEKTKVSTLEVSYGQPSLAILSHDIDQHQRRLHLKCGCGNLALLRGQKK